MIKTAPNRLLPTNFRSEILGPLSLTYFLLVATLFGHSQVPQGVYRSSEQLVKNAPDFYTEVELIETRGQSMDGQPLNQFRLRSDSLKRYFFRTKVFAYANDTALYINGEKIDRFEGFAKCYTTGNFLVFHSPNVKKNATGPATVVGAIVGGAVGGLIGYAIDSSTGERVPYWGLYVYSQRTGNVRRMTEEYLFARLQDHPKLRRQFSREDFPSDDDSLIRYMQLINDKIAEESGHN